MNSLSDQELLRDYSESHSEAAFAELVCRHIDFVYSAALRMVRDAHLAEDVTQRVFVALAGSSGQLVDHPVLLGWLHRTAQNLATKIVRSDVRRRALEQEVFAMNEIRETETDAPWENVAPHLDSALGELSEADRNAVLLRYFQRQSAREMAVTLGTSEDAAQKRVSRAVERLRELFTERGVTVGLGGLATVLTAHAVQAAPVGLGAAISTATVTKATVAVAAKWVVAKSMAAVIVAAFVLVAVLKLLLPQPSGAASPVPPPAAAIAKPLGVGRAGLPIKLSNDAFSGPGDARHLVELDPAGRRSAGSEPAGHIKTLVPAGGRGAPDFLRAQSSGHARVAVTNGSPILGKRIRVTGWIKTREVENWTGFGCMILNAEGRLFSVDEMMDRPVRGTTDWQQLQLVADVPAENCFIIVGGLLYGTGEIWIDDFQIDVVSTNTATTDDRRWHKWSPNSPDYSVGLDPENPHDGHPALRLAYVPDGRAPRGSWMWWGQCIREPEKYAGHTVRMTVWVKCEDASGTAGINLRPKGPNFELLTEDRKPRRHITGTTDWVQRSIFCAIPPETQCLDTGFYFNGSGKIWIDMESLKYEISDDPAPAQ